MERGPLDAMQFVLAAGGTGGHMIPAHALAAELRSRGHGVLLITDERGRRIPGLFDGVPIEVLQAGRITRNPIALVKGVASILAGRRAARALYRRGRPDAVIGFGGYPAFPALLAAGSMGIPTVLHEQNAVLGRVNRLLAGQARAIATAYERIERLKPAHWAKCVLVGNPVRAAVVRLGEQPFPPFDEFSPLKILITGGSQGATVLGRVVPRGFAALDPSLRHRLQIVQQCRPDDIELVREAYRQLQIPAELTTYIDDMPAKLGDAQLVIGRAGASTIAELTAAGRPAILIPLPIATDDHQTVNAREMARAGGARMIPQDQFTPEALARQIEALAADPEALANAAARALSVGRPRAAQDLADLVERIADRQAPLVVGAAGSSASLGLAPAGAAA